MALATRPLLFFGLAPKIAEVTTAQAGGIRVNLAASM
jgi:hypothetical protein